MKLEAFELDSVERSICKYLEQNSSVSLSSLSDVEEDLSNHGLDSLQLIQLVIWIEGVTGKPVEIEALFSNSVFSIASISQYVRAQQAH